MNPKIDSHEKKKIRKTLPLTQEQKLKVKQHQENLRTRLKQLLLDKESYWPRVVAPFLGRLPDSVIAKCTGVSASTIGKLRRTLSLSSYTKATSLKEIERNIL